MDAEQNSFSHVLGVISSMPALQLTLIILSAAVWIIGGNILSVLHYRRVGKPWWSIFDLRSFELFRFNGIEWLALAGLFVVAATLGVAAVTFAAPAGA